MHFFGQINKMKL